MSNNSASDRVPLREAVRLNLRSMKLWLKKNPGYIVSTVSHNIVDALIPYVGIYLSALIIGELAGARDPQTLTRLVLIALISAAVLSLLKAALFRWWEGNTDARYYSANQFYVDKLLSLDFDKMDHPHTHDLYSHVTQNTSWGGWGIMKSVWHLGDLVKSLMTIFGAIALSWTLFAQRVPESGGALTLLNNPLIITLLVVLMLVITYVAPMISNKAGIYWVKHGESARLGNRFFSHFGFMGYDRKRALDIRIYEQERICKTEIDKFPIFTPRSQIARNARGPMGGLHALSAAVSHVFTGIVYIFVCLKAWGGAFGVGAVVQYVSAITALSGGVSSLISTLGDMRNNASFLRTTFAFLDIPNDMYQGSLTTEKRSDRKYDIEFRNVSFKYPGQDTYALKDISIKFAVGQRLAVVGMNGSGKTTFIKLLCRLYDPTEGTILLNGIDMRKYDYHEYMSIFSVVFQDFKLLAFGLGQNMAAAKDYDPVKAAACLDGAGFAERLKTMPNGLDTNLYKEFDKQGVEVSGGEAQKIALARALYKDAAFVILDEPTAALDPIAEFEVYSRMNEIVGGKTAVFISHRLSSCRFCNDIAVFHEGRVIQRGGHEDLVADAGGKYHELWNAQAQYYTE